MKQQLPVSLTFKRFTELVLRQRPANTWPLNYMLQSDSLAGWLVKAWSFGLIDSNSEFLPMLLEAPLSSLNHKLVLHSSNVSTQQMSVYSVTMSYSTNVPAVYHNVAAPCALKAFSSMGLNLLHLGLESCGKAHLPPPWAGRALCCFQPVSLLSRIFINTWPTCPYLTILIMKDMEALEL